ncbi:uncharacterized protein LOC103719676 [Phoenix dactylifera]|uniref:Uncharacterized protein LOC103719676 n=1 Tax=Phoenix dactylifera TaxID=42345 RepID=A0A8B7CV65_PHODC|nr:uncharacterized protein LOC103719676 [Phoenix dactylifera]
MAPSLVPPPSAPSAISARTPRYNGQWNAAPECDKPIARFHRRRVFIYGLIASGIGSLSPDGANAAQRRPPPPPPEEKKDPSVSGLQAKVLASKKRKEAMKEEMTKLREKGKPVDR